MHRGDPQPSLVVGIIQVGGEEIENVATHRPGEKLMVRMAFNQRAQRRQPVDACIELGDDAVDGCFQQRPGMANQGEGPLVDTEEAFEVGGGERIMCVHHPMVPDTPPRTPWLTASGASD